MDEELLRRFRARPTEELEQVLAQPDDYTEPAREAAVQALAERGIKAGRPAATPDPKAAGDAKARPSKRGPREALIVALFLSLVWIPFGSDLLEDWPALARTLIKVVPTSVIFSLLVVVLAKDRK